MPWPTSCSGSGNSPESRGGAGLDRLDGVPLATAFAVQLVQRLRDQDPAVTPALRWLDGRLAAQGTSADDIVRVEHQRQGAMNVTVRNVILSMGLLSALDWTEFFESVSLVDEVLQAGTDCAALDFPTRDRYRHAIEELARGSGRTELDVARETVHQVERARAGGDGSRPPNDERYQDPGYYLIGGGRRVLEQALAFRAPAGRRLLRLYVAAATPGYVGTIIVLSGFLLAPPVLAAEAWALGAAGLLLVLLAGIPASDAVIALLNRAVAATLPPRVLPRLELRDGVPAHLRTLIAVPTLLADRAEVEEIRRAARGPLPGKPGGRLSLRGALRLAGCADGERTRRRGDARRSPRGHRAPEPAARRRAGGRHPILPAPSPALLERERGALDGMGAQARQAP